MFLVRIWGLAYKVKQQIRDLQSLDDSTGLGAGMVDKNEPINSALFAIIKISHAVNLCYRENNAIASVNMLFTYLW